MTKKLRYFCTLLLMMVAGVGFAGTIQFSTLGLTNGTQYTDPFDGDDFTVTFAGGENDGKYYTTGSGIRVYANGTMTIAAKSSKITAITLTFSGTYKPGSDNVVNVGTYDPATGKWAGEAETVVFTNPSGSVQWRVQKIEVTVKGGKKEANLSFGSNTAFTVEPNASFTAPALSNPNSLAVTYSSTDSNVASVDASTGAVTIGSEEGTATIKASFAGNDEYNAGEATYTITIIDSDAPGAVNNPYNVADAITYINGLTVNTLSTKDVYVSGIISRVGDFDYDMITYWISDDGTTTNELQVYKGKGKDGAGFTAQTDLSIGDQVTVCGKVKKYQNNSGTIIPEFDTGSKIVAIVKNTKKDPELAFSMTSIDVELEEAFTEPTLTNPYSLTVTYSSDKETVATVASDGKLTIVGAGTARITASFAGNDEYNVGSASYLVKVTDPNVLGGRKSPYTVAQARAAIDNNTGITGVYVQGVVSKIVTAYNSQYGNISYNISADGSTSAVQLQAYRGKSYNGDNFTSSDDIRVGDIVVVYGDLTKHEDTYELAAGNQLYSLERPVSQEIHIVASDVTLEYNATSGEIEYTIENPQTGVTINAALDESCDWISNIQVGETITFTTTANEGEADRSATITLSYTGAEDKVVTITQKFKMIAVESDDSKTTFYFTNNKWGIPTTKTVTEASFTADDYTITLKGSSGNGYSYYNNGNYLMLGKTGAYLTLPAFSFPVSEIEVVGNSIASAAVKQNIFVGNVAVSTETTGATGTNTYTIADAYQAVGTIYTLKVTSNANTQITQIIVHKAVEQNVISTGINQVEQIAEGAAIYNLNGVRVNKMQKGVYVVNGKKVVIK